MANHKSALKRVRQTKVRTERNRTRKTAIKTLRKKTAAAVATSDKKTADQTLPEYFAVVDKAAKKGLIHKNKAANLKRKAAKAVASIA
jgi:small subunit ribosomal protein S20